VEEEASVTDADCADAAPSSREARSNNGNATRTGSARAAGNLSRESRDGLISEDTTVSGAALLAAGPFCATLG
jgi:hypothetical protein